ncbi:ANTAR domain-containing response regulator [Sneathiella chinensis]|uniref:ANTAR domain-containing response regulator n=1 Tax=Sneathiella chinensis TaxID=349750 RepID=UPI0019D05F4F|nr:ANTAR domain-containing protein [Sneathiella chinensis]
MRESQALVIHPDDEDGVALTRHLNRVGCSARRMWPAPDTLPEGVKVVLFLLSPEVGEQNYDWMSAETDVARIAIISYETPEILSRLAKLSTHSVLTKPIRLFGILAAVTNAVQMSKHVGRLNRRIRLLDETLKGRRKIENAVQALMKERGVNEEEAYRLLRDKAMKNRISVVALAEAYLLAHGI